MSPATESPRDTLIAAATREAGLPASWASAMQRDCPWLDCETEVSGALGPELLAEQAAQAGLSPAQVERFLDAYNARVRVVANPFEALQSEAYAEVCAALAGHGREDACGDGDYWVNEDSFSSRAPVVVVFGAFRLPGPAVQALQGILSRYADVFSKLRIATQDGDEGLTLRSR